MPNSSDITLYKNGVKLETNSLIYTHYETGVSELVLNLSALDKTSIYKVEIQEIDAEGQTIRAVGHFEIQNN